MTVTRRYRPVLQWLCQGENSGDDQWNLVRFFNKNHSLQKDVPRLKNFCPPLQAGDFACLVLLTPLASVSAFLCTSGASIYASQGQVMEAVSEHLHRIRQVLLHISLRSGRSGLLVRGSLPSFLLWLLLTVRYHCQVSELPTS